MSTMIPVPTALKRTNHWATRELHTFLIEHADKPFSYGTHDCSLFAANAILAMTGTDIASDFRGKYTTQLGALKAIKTVTGTGTQPVDAIAYCAAKHGLTELTHPLMAQRGDLVAFQNGSDVIGGIVHLSGRHVVSVAETGLVRLPITTIVRAWRV